ncbi:AraC family transcriptional regulator [Chitinophaga sp. Cy-1792]|uniref:helix-turn-helix domain-containing protein n=1 Tax=Chitinophaga sp. Cy-1792 TaxID=2608339 RepID=UPI0014239EFB|nr:AraC family transcriptional regulator [Chitinophaga sp. Cy-1792]NIG55893.1 helix-turn-helix transcriptional regulator [Chitinophaga sp. Cy-1792]
MKKVENKPVRFDSLTAVHRQLGLPAPKHPLISLINGSQPGITGKMPNGPHILNYYKISYKPPFSGKIKYGQSYYDFDEGGLLFASPGQVIGGSEDSACTNAGTLILLIHPDFLLHHQLAKKIRQYGYFSYTANEALHMSEEEKNIILSIFQMIERELNSRIDDFSQDVMLSQLELLFSYADRFYKRQFITRKIVSNDLLQQLETVIDQYLDDEGSEGLPTVQYLASQLHLSPGYLSDMLRSLIGQNAQQYIHDKLIAKSRELLSTTNMSVSAIAFQLGFEHSQSFSKFFKIKTKVSPMQFRQSFN